MTTHNPMAVEAGRLLASLASQVDGHLLEVEGDLHQTNALLMQAVAQLTESFMAIHAAVAAQQGILQAGAGVATQQAQAFAAHATEIQTRVNAIVTGMQFQDMTEQLIKRTTRRIEGVREVLATLDGKAGELVTASSPEAGAQSLRELDDSVRTQSENLERTMWKAVCQTRMDSGDIDLF